MWKCRSDKVLLIDWRDSVTTCIINYTLHQWMAINLVGVCAVALLADF